MKKILITGAGGFWGFHLARHLCQKGYQVTGTYHRKKTPGLGKIAWRFLDVTDGAMIAKTVRELKPDAICHLAGQSSLTLSWKMPEKTFSLNTLSTVYFLSAIQCFSPKTRFILTSSIHVYGRSFYKTGAPLSENDFTWPEGPYAVSKRIAEFACLDLNKQFGIDCLVLRPINCIGPHLSGHFVFSDWSRQIVACERRSRPACLKVGNLQVRRDFLHISDGVRGYEKVLRRGKSGQIYNLSSQRAVPLRRYAESLVKLARVPVKIEVQRSRFRRFDPAAIRVSSAKLRKLGWKPKTEAITGLRDLLAQWRTQSA